MKNRIEFLFIVGVGWLVLILGFHFHSKAQTSSSRIQWMNDAVYFTTNLVIDTERNKTLPTNSNLTFYKEAISTNKVTRTFFIFGYDRLELGAREDGIIVWRKEK